MNYQRIDATFDQAKTLLKPELVSWLELNRRNISDLYLYGAIDENDLVGFAVYVIYEEYSSVCNLVYVEVKEDLRRNYIGETLVKDSARDLRRMGYKLIKAGTTAEDNILEELLKKNDFEKIFNAETVTYSMQDMKDALEDEKFEQFEEAFKYIKCYLDYESDDPKLKEFEEWLSETRPGVMLNKLNKRYTCFFELKDKIYGYAAVQKVRNNYIVMRDLDVVRTKETKLAPALMLAYLMKIMREEMPEDTTFTMTFRDRTYAQVMETMYGKPASSEVYNEYSIVC